MTLQTKTNWRQLNVTVTQTVAIAGRLVAQEKETEKRCFFSEHENEVQVLELRMCCGSWFSKTERNVGSVCQINVVIRSRPWTLNEEGISTVTTELSGFNQVCWSCSRNDMVHQWKQFVVDSAIVEQVELVCMLGMLRTKHVARFWTPWTHVATDEWRRSKPAQHGLSEV